MSDEIKRLIDEEAEAFEESKADDDGRPYGRPRPPRDGGQVFSLRMPVERLEALRSVAAKCGERPSTLMRRWVLERLAEELGMRATYDDPQSPIGPITVVFEHGEHSLKASPEHLARQIAEHLQRESRSRER